MMPEYFVVANSFAAPFVSDQSIGYAVADTPKEALEKFADSYRHPAGLFSANVYASADAYHKGERELARWLSNKAQAVEGATTLYSHDAGHVEIDGAAITINKPREGRVM